MAIPSADFCLDDAWIHLAYAKSVKLGEGLSYNPHDHETGFSSPLWVLALSLWPWAANPVLAVKLLGALAHAAAAFGTAAAAGRVVSAERPDAPGRARLCAAVAGAVCALDPALTYAAVSGMEVSLAAALVVFSLDASYARRPRTAAVLAAVAVWARPEALPFFVVWAGLRAHATRDARQLTPAVAAAVALGAWMLYCQLVSGHPWPNTYYAKRDAQLGRGLLYLVLQYLPQHAFWIGVGGAVLLVLAVRQRGEPQRLVLAWLAALVAIAASRRLEPGTLFYSWRYFAPLAIVPCVALAASLPERRTAVALLLAPIALALALLLPQVRELQRAQERSISRLHTEPARWLAAELPRSARIAVEGAGATRFFLPRSVRVIDVVGLNDASVVHANDAKQRTCTIVRAQPTHALLPSAFVRAYGTVFSLEPWRRFDDPSYAISARTFSEHVLAAKVAGIPALVRRTCGVP